MSLEPPATLYKLHSRETIGDNCTQAVRVLEAAVRATCANSGKDEP